MNEHLYTTFTNYEGTTWIPQLHGNLTANSPPSNFNAAWEDMYLCKVPFSTKLRMGQQVLVHVLNITFNENVFSDFLSPFTRRERDTHGTANRYSCTTFSVNTSKETVNLDEEQSSIVYWATSGSSPKCYKCFNQKQCLVEVRKVWNYSKTWQHLKTDTMVLIVERCAIYKHCYKHFNKSSWSDTSDFVTVNYKEI